MISDNETRIRELQSARRYWAQYVFQGHRVHGVQIIRNAYMNALCELERLGAL